MNARTILEVFKRWCNTRKDTDLNHEDEGLCLAILHSLPIIARHIPEAPVEWKKKGRRNIWRCPTCGKRHTTKHKPNYCYECGQRIDWTEERYLQKELERRPLAEQLADAAARCRDDFVPLVKRNENENESEI